MRQASRLERRTFGCDTPLANRGRVRLVKSLRIGDLLVHVWPGTSTTAPAAVAAHGITANGLSWARVAELLDGRVTLLAPDLRGRAGSRDAPGPYGLARHADDLIAILDELNIDRAVLVGHSMGAYVAALAAIRHPGRTGEVVLVDGGLARPLPPGSDPQAVLAAVIGPALQRLSMTFPTRQAYREFWQAHPALAGEWSPWVEAYTQYDLVGSGPFRSSCDAEAIRVDGTEMLADPDSVTAIHRLPVPGVLLYAERGFANEADALYNEERLAGLAIPTMLVPDTNHYTILLTEHGAGAVAEQVLRAGR
jgi:pimeloyl-ACP methyl ester carboxylesterase